jgi:PIN domain nuclease of toxin-antitoxin system
LASLCRANAWVAGVPLLVSPISAWEIGVLVARNRLALSVSPTTWIDRILATPGVALADMSPNVLIASSYLPPGCPNDPADRILAATVRAQGLTLITRDRRLLAYGEAGHIRAVAC